MIRDARRWVGSERFGPVSVTVALVFFGVFTADVVRFAWAGDYDMVGQDLTIYLDATRRLLEGGSFYLAHQLEGPYVVSHGDVLYPPTIIPLLTAFLVLPIALWWAIPIGCTAAMLAWHRPSP